ncbi:hypothetical protein T11_387 [Trichinella zimbabwensis]|uniref:Uncharacterized protein n=1 Tax=Trichinella zimbabwensis TaxID=268475 RepID=A0A0V1GF53_9BILA|nr:hypothetical protein T11_387 [Trichinella zimbabwensis]
MAEKHLRKFSKSLVTTHVGEDVKKEDPPPLLVGRKERRKE